MKTLKAILLLFAAMAIVTACDPMEDESLRDKYITNAGDPISKEELNNILSVTQPIPNQDDAVEGDQYVVLKNNRLIYRTGFATCNPACTCDDRRMCNTIDHCCGSGRNFTGRFRDLNTGSTGDVGTDDITAIVSIYKNKEFPDRFGTSGYDGNQLCVCSKYAGNCV